MKSLPLLVATVVLSGCSHVVSRQISVFPRVKSREAPVPGKSRLEVEGSYLQRTVLRFELDDSVLAYTNRRLEEESLGAFRAVRLIEYGLLTKTRLLTLPVAHASRFAFIEVEFEQVSDHTRFRKKAEVQTNIPPADHFIGPATRGAHIDDQLLGESMAGFVASRMMACIDAMVASLKTAEPERQTEHPRSVLLHP